MIKKHTVLTAVLAAFLLPAGAIFGFADEVSRVEIISPPRILCNTLPPSPPHLREALETLLSPSEGVFWTHSRLVALGREIEALADDGLDPAFYDFAYLEWVREQVADGERLTRCHGQRVWWAYLRSLHDLYYGRVDPEAEGLMWYAEGTREAPAAEVLVGLASVDAEAGVDKSIARAFEKSRPTSPVYNNLRKAMRLAEDRYPSSWPEVPSGPLLRRGDRDPGVVPVKQRLRREGYLPSLVQGTEEDELYSEELESAVLAFQRRHGIKDDGVVGPATRRELNVQPGHRVAQLKANLERLRWFERDREPVMVMVDIAGAVVSFLYKGEVGQFSRAQAGKPSRETPALKSRITHVTLNPTWTVPPTILRRDILPAVREDRGYLAANNIRVLDLEGRELDPAEVDWHDPGAIMLRQDAGPGAALGRVAIRFPNPFAVFLHDTPRQHLFATSGRFYSSGCVRVEDALNLTELLFREASVHTLAIYERTLRSGRTGNLSLPAPVPLLMFYWTALADERGVVTFRPDIYDWDGRLLRLLVEQEG